MTNPANSDVQNLLPVQAYFSVTGEFQTFIGQGQPFYASVSPDQSGLHITNSTIDSSVIGGITPAAGTFTSIAATTGTVATAPSGPTDIANKQYVDYFAAGLSWKQPVVCATTTNISSLSGLLTVDTVTLQDGDRVLVKNQTNKALNGIYVAHSTAWTYAIGADDWNEYLGAVVFIVSGGQKDSAWYSLAQPGGTLGVTDLEFGNFTISAIYSAGTGLTLTGTVFSITDTAVVANSYGSASSVATFTVNGQGQLTAAATTSIAIAASQITSGTIDSARISGSYTGITGVGTLTAGTWQANPIAVLYGGTGATTAADARTNLGAAASGANSDISSMSGLTGAVGTPDSITFDIAPATIPTAQGALYWDNTDSIQTLSLVMEGGNAIQQIGEESYFRIKCSSAITEGQVVMFTGTVGASGGLTGAPATGLTAATASYIMGVATESGATNDWIYVTNFGLVRGINTTGGAEAWVDGQILYYDPTVTGGLTKTLPSAPNAKVQVCAVVHAASNGSLFIRPSFGGILGQYEGDVGFTSVTAGDLIQRNVGNTAWVNVAASSIAAGSVANAVTFNSSGGAAAGTSFNGSVARTIDYSTVGAPSASGTGASGTWSISVTGSAGSATTATTATNIAGGAAGSLPYQTASGTTAMLAASTNGYYLTLSGGLPAWAALPASGLTITDNTSSASTFYPALSAVTTGTITEATTSSTKLSFVPSTGTLTATKFVGDGSSLTGVGGFPSGTVMLFAQTSAPTGWTKLTNLDNYALRVVSGTASTGGSVAFTTAFASQTPAGSVSINTSGLSAGATTLNTTQMPAHTHTWAFGNSPDTGSNFVVEGAFSRMASAPSANVTTASTGGGGSHTHSISGSATGSFTGTAINLAVQYVDVIRASKD